ncbi:MAG TPA: glycosyl transferase, partial [Prolixibacteraceae bacterium]|nr:glycosyl transferase [Prolixibacteraceae bacterium]
MKKVLVVNHYWPPTGGACVQRWVDFSTNLAEMGYEITVLTPDNPGFEQIDHSLEKRVDSRINVVKI